jgi:hypothetical protein
LALSGAKVLTWCNGAVHASTPHNTWHDWGYVDGGLRPGRTPHEHTFYEHLHWAGVMLATHGDMGVTEHLYHQTPAQLWQITQDHADNPYTNEYGGTR